jgi:hypothetical protein
MTLKDVVVALQRRLFNALKESDRHSALEVFTMLSFLQELSYDGDNRALTGILVDLGDAAREVAIGGKPKSVIPSIEDINAVFISTNP